MANNDYITTDCKLTISKDTAKLDEELFLYKNDKNIKLLIQIEDKKYRYKTDTPANLLTKYKASYAQVKWYKNAEVKKEFPIQATDDGKVVFIIEGELINEDTELGDYDLQIRLLNENQESIRSLPIIKGAVHILKPLFETSDIATVNSAVTDVSMLSLDGAPIDTYNSDGTYNQTNWGNGDIISSAKLNKLEKVAKDNVDKVNKIPAKSIVEDGKLYLAKADGTKLDSGTILPVPASYDDTEVKADIQTLKTNEVNLVEDETSMEGIKDNEYPTLTTTNKTLIGSINEVKDTVDSKTNNIQTQINNMVLGKSETDENIKAEVQQARGNNGLLNERLNFIEDTIGHLSKGDDTKTYLNFKWEIGGFNGSTGNPTEATDRIKTTTYFHSSKELFYDVAEGYSLYLYPFSYDSTTNTYTYDNTRTYQKTGKGSCFLNNTSWYKFGIKKSGTTFNGSEYKNLKLWNEEKCAIAKKTDLYSPNIKNYNVPSYWESTIKNKETQIKDIVIKATKNNEIINMFFTSTDNHYPINNYVSPDLMSYLSEKCGISMSLCLGDLITDSTVGHDDGLNRLQDAMKQLQRMSNVLLITQGNHDNNCGIKDSNGKLNSERIIYDNEWILHTSNKLDTNNINFYSNGKAFYYDDKLQKIRFISIDSFENKSYTINEGNVDNFNLGQPSNEQINWIKDVALTNIPSNYSVVSFSHLSLFPIYANNGTSDVNLNLGGMGNSDAITKVFKDFKTNGGEYIGHFSGHVHHDFMNNQAGFYCIQTLNDGTHWREASYFAGNEFVGDAPKKIAKTTNECAFDVVIINRTTHKVNLIRIGAGEDREFTY